MITKYLGLRPSTRITTTAQIGIGRLASFQYLSQLLLLLLGIHYFLLLYLLVWERFSCTQSVNHEFLIIGFQKKVSEREKLFTHGKHLSLFGYSREAKT